MTRQEYMTSTPGESRDAATSRHRAYHAQYVTAAVVQYVARNIGADRILKSKDPHFNDIPLNEWDYLCGAIARGSSITWVDSCPFSFKAAMAKNGDYPTLGSLVCIMKEAARQIKEAANVH